MCRIVAYFGPRLRLSALIHEAPHSLLEQSRASREMGHGNVAGDGWGVGWFAQQGAHPGLIKSILPLWSDLNAQTAMHAIASGAIVGHIRLASPAIEVCFTNTPLYRLDDHLFTINGELKPWPGSLSRELRGRLDDESEADIRGSTDAEMLGALWRTHFHRNGRRDAALALREAIREARDLALEHQDGAIRLCVVVAGKDGFVAARFGEPLAPPSLHYLTGQDRWRGGVLVASEPFDDGPGWHDVEPSTLLLADKHGLRVDPL